MTTTKEDRIMGSDPFEDAGGPVETEPDPFADEAPAALGEAENSQLQSEAEAGTPPPPASAIDPPDEEPPLVNREGQPVSTPPADTQPADTAAAATEAPAPTPETAPAGPPEQPPADPAAPPAQEDGPEAAQVGDQGAPAAPPAAEQPANGNGTAEAAQDAEDGKGKPRLYHAMYQTGATEWTDIALKPEMDNVVTDGGKLWLQARSADHARRLCWGIVGRPQEGVTLVCVAKGGWSPKRVRPKPPEPTRERLEIS